VFKRGKRGVKMLNYKYLKKLTSIIIVVAFIFNIQGGILLYSQEKDIWEEQLDKAKQEYKEVKYPEAIQRIDVIIRYNQDRKDLLGKCYLLLGAVYEKQGDSKNAEVNYSKAKEEYGIETIEGVDLENLDLYRQIVKGEVKEVEKPQVENNTQQVIQKEAKKRKFPVLLVVAGVVVVTAAIIFLSKKKKEKQYTLTVNLDEGVEGTPSTGTNTYKEGTPVNYSYTLKPGYNNLVVQLDGAAASSSGTITMNQNHALTASAGTNVVTFVTSQDTIQIPEGGTASFNVRLSAQPTANVNVTVGRESGDNDISVISGAAITFTTTNWNTDQTVTLQAAQDADTANGQATIAISAAGIPQKSITAIEQDDDVASDLTVKIVKPANGTQVSRGITVDIEASARSSIGIERVEFYVNTRLIGTDRNAPYTARWDTAGEWEGSYLIRARAYDNNANAKEASITVQVLAL
jgi:hypothetical protein